MSKIPRHAMAAGVVILAAMLPAGTGAQSGEMVAANLFGTEVEGGGAGEKASGDFNGLVDRSSGELCYFLEGFDIEGEVTGAHIHQGRSGKVGEEVAALEMAEMDEACVTLDPALVARILRKRDDFYVDIHTADHPEGAVRGQLIDR